MSFLKSVQAMQILNNLQTQILEKSTATLSDYIKKSSLGGNHTFPTPEYLYESNVRGLNISSIDVFRGTR